MGQYNGDLIKFYIIYHSIVQQFLYLKKMLLWIYNLYTTSSSPSNMGYYELYLNFGRDGTWLRTLGRPRLRAPGPMLRRHRGRRPGRCGGGDCRPDGGDVEARPSPWGRRWSVRMKPGGARARPSSHNRRVAAWEVSVARGGWQHAGRRGRRRPSLACRLAPEKPEAETFQ